MLAWSCAWRKTDRTKAVADTSLERLFRREDVPVREKCLWRLLYETVAPAQEVRTAPPTTDTSGRRTGRLRNGSAHSRFGKAGCGVRTLGSGGHESVGSVFAAGQCRCWWVRVAAPTAIRMGTSKARPVWVNSRTSTIAVSGARWVVARTAAATDEGVGAQRCAGPQVGPQAAGGGAEQSAGGECGGEQSAGGPAAQAQGGGQGFEQDQGGEQRQAQCAVEGELGGAFAVAEELGEGDGQGTDRREQHGGGYGQSPAAGCVRACRGGELGEPRTGNTGEWLCQSQLAPV